MGRRYSIEADPPVVCILGRRGSGKTTWALRALRSHSRYLVWDPKREYPGEVFTSLSVLYRRLLAVGSGPVRISFRPMGVSQGPEYFDAFCEVVYAFGACTVVFDEVDRFSGPGPIIPPWFSMLINEGRHARVEMWGIARRPARVPKDLIENAHRLIIFHMKGGAVEYLKSTIGKESAEKLPTLPPLTYLEWSDSDEIKIKKV